jgi:hypothetical protein
VQIDIIHSTRTRSNFYYKNTCHLKKGSTRSEDLWEAKF